MEEKPYQPLGNPKPAQQRRGFQSIDLIFAAIWMAVTFAVVCLLQIYRPLLSPAMAAALCFVAGFSPCIAVWELWGRRLTWLLPVFCLIIATIAIASQCFGLYDP